MSGTASHTMKGENIKMRFSDFYIRWVQIAKKAVGRLRRRLVKLPEIAVIRTINRTVRFEHEFLRYLDEDDFRAMLTESYDITLCSYLRRNLTPGDIFIDVGANVGYISAVAASCVGVSGEVHGFEPLMECYARLQKLCQLNPNFKFAFNNVALGETEGFLPIRFNLQGDSRNATVVPGKPGAETRQIPVRRLDEYIKQNIPSPARIKIIKIDVEGYEYVVLKGLERFLMLEKYKPTIVCEIKPWELANVGATLKQFEQYIKRFGYRTFDINHPYEPVSLSHFKEMAVVLFRN